MTANTNKPALRFAYPLEDKGAPYWICKACADERGGVPFKTANTLAQLPCKYCNGANQLDGEFITPIVDLRWPRREAT